VEAVQLMRRRRAEGLSLAQIGRELGVGPALLWDWARKLDGRGTGAVAEPAPGRLPGETVEEENRRLRRENAILRQEREFAKKAAAFFATESR
jgi:transposase